MGYKIMVCLVFMLGSTSSAAATLDKGVQAFIASSPAPSELTVFVGYQLSHPEAHRSLAEIKAENRKLATRVLRGIVAKASIENMWIAHGTYVRLTRAEILSVAGDPRVKSIRVLPEKAFLIPALNSTRHFLGRGFTYGLEKMGVDKLRSDAPLRDGRGVKVGILDTGVNANHPALMGKVSLFKDFIVGKSAAPYDDQGHGTHIAGTIAGGDVSGLAIGVAPGARLIVAKVFNASGGSTSKGLLAGMQWMADPDGNPNTDDAPNVVSSSWGMNVNLKDYDPSDSPFCDAVDSWVKLGILPVFAAGNLGSDPETIQLPAACPAAIAAGATDANDEVADFSSRGPAQWKGVQLPKPNISAPGVDIESADLGDGIATKSGTSMAAPHVAGALALLSQGHLRVDAGQVLNALYQGATDLGAPGFDFDYGVGRVDVVHSLAILGQAP